MNIEHPTSNFEWEKKKKQSYHLEETLLKKPNIPSPLKTEASISHYYFPAKRRDEAKRTKFDICDD